MASSKSVCVPISGQNPKTFSLLYILQRTAPLLLEKYLKCLIAYQNRQLIFCWMTNHKSTDRLSCRLYPAIYRKHCAFVSFLLRKPKFLYWYCPHSKYIFTYLRTSVFVCMRTDLKIFLCITGSTSSAAPYAFLSVYPAVHWAVVNHHIKYL